MFSPFGPASSNRAEWHPEPGFRGTYGILSSCLITLGLCIWTAVHLNVPEHGKAYLQKWRKMKWLAIALLAPEVIAWTAFEQRREASKIQTLVRRALGQPEIKTVWQSIWSLVRRIFRKEHGQEPDPERIRKDDATSSKTETWTMTHSHLAAMGGFAFDTSNTEHNFLPGNRTQIKLTGKGICALAKVAPALLPNLTKEQILDKSKVDGIGKTLVCVQALWFCLQCISRVAVGLSISLLELNTFAHALCTLVAYFLWWNKPHDVNEPVLIQGPTMHEVCAAMCMRSSIGAVYEVDAFLKGEKQEGWIWQYSEQFSDTLDIGLLETMAVHKRSKNFGSFPISPEIPVDSGQDAVISYNLRERSILDPDQNLAAEQTTRVYMGQSLFGFTYRRMQSKIRSQIRCGGIVHIQRPYLDLAPSDVLCWNLASQGLSNYPLGSTSDGGYVSNERGIHRRSLTEYVTDRVGNLPGMGSVYEASDWDLDSLMVLCTTFTIASLFYGILHLTAWNAPFRSARETLLWRISGVSLAVSGFITRALVLSFRLFLLLLVQLDETKVGKMFKLWLRWLERLEEKFPIIFELIGLSLFYFFIIFICSVGIGWVLLYAFSRVYLVVGCFLSLPYLSPSTMNMPQWSLYFLHFM